MSVRSPPAILLLCFLLAACGEVDTRASTTEEQAIATQASDPAGIPERFDSLFAAAQEVYFSGEYDSAAVLLQHVHDAARREGAIPHQARALTWVGLAHYRLADYPTARRVSEEALAFKLQHRLVDQYARSYNALGLIAWNENRHTDAERRFQQATEAAKNVGDRLLEAIATGNLALPLTELGQFAAARTALLAAQAKYAELGDARVRERGNVFTNLGMLEIRLGNPSGAIPLLRKALELYRPIDYGTGIQSALGQLGTAYTELGDAHRAFAMLDSALTIAAEQGLEQERASNLEAMAELYRRAGDFRRALALYDSANAINADIGLDVEMGVNLRGEAAIHDRLGDIEGAHRAAGEGLAIHRRAGAPMEVLLDLLTLAEIEDRLDSGDQVEARLLEARSLAGELGARIARVDVGLTEARIADRHRRSEDVLQAVSRIERDLGRGGYSAEAEARLLESRALARLGRSREAATAGRRALATVERVRSNFGSGVLRTAFVADKRDVYAHFISVLLRLGEVEEAFAVADAARGRVLLERLSAAGTSATSEAATAAFSEGEILLVEIDRLVESIDVAEEATPPDQQTPEQARELAQLYDRLERARDAYEGLLVRAAETDRDQAAFMGGTQTDVTAVRAALRPGQLLVEYFVPANGPVLTFVASPQSVQVLESPVTTRNLVSRIRLARALMARAGGPDSQLDGVLTALHEALIRPLLQAGILSGVDELIIVPHQVLAYLPYAALRDGTTHRYFVQDHDLRMLPSAAALPVLAERSRPKIVAGTSAFAPFPAELPATRLEVQTVTAGGRTGRRLIGGAATEPALRRALVESDVVHVATHGVMNAQNPMFSRLDLARNNGGEPADDGRLEVHELLGLTIDSRLVFLSGCETGVGAAYSTAFVQGEDYTTLAQAFLYAGAGSVIATLWPVADAGAAAFAETFYRALEDRTPAAALAEAQRTMMNEAEFASPYHWASYQLSGYVSERPTAHAGANIRDINYGATRSDSAGLPTIPMTARSP